MFAYLQKKKPKIPKEIVKINSPAIKGFFVYTAHKISQIKSTNESKTVMGEYIFHINYL